MAKMNQFRTNYQIFMEKARVLEETIQNRNFPERAKTVLTGQVNSSIEQAKIFGIETAKRMLETVYTYVK